MMIRKACISDFDTVTSFYDEVIDELKNLRHHPDWKKGIYPNRNLIENLISRNVLYLAEEKGSISGAFVLDENSNSEYCSVKWSTDAAMDECLVIHLFAVRIKERGKGTADMLLAHAVREASDAGRKAVRLDVLVGNNTADRFYLRNGFKYIDTISMYYEDTGTVMFNMYEYAIEGAKKGHGKG